MAERRNDGTWLQEKLAADLKKFTSHNPAFWYRFPDTKAAQGAYLQSQPGDFFLMVPGACFLIECKSTVSNGKLLSLAHHGEVGKRQIAKHRLWHRAGHPSLYLFGDCHEGLAKATFTWFDGRDVVAKRNYAIDSGGIRHLIDSIPYVTQKIKISMGVSDATNV